MPREDSSPGRLPEEAEQEGTGPCQGLGAPTHAHSRAGAPAGHRLSESAVSKPPCVLRSVLGENTVDPEKTMTLSWTGQARLE